MVSPGSSPALTEPDRVDLRIEVFGFAGFHILTNRTSVAASGDQYSIAMDLDTRGIARVFVDLTSHSEVRGRIGGNAAQPEAYRGDVHRNGVDRSYRVDYRQEGAVATVWKPPAREWQSSASVDQVRGTVDQLTAYFILERQLARRGSCTLAVPVFDGHSRYNLRFSDAKTEKIAADNGQGFSGDTHVCDVTREEVVGLPDDHDLSESTYQRGKVWYAHIVPGDQMVPVRMEFDTEYGVVRGYLAELHGRGVNLRFME